MSVYQDIFSNWTDVQNEFDMKEPEPAEVLYARYGYEDYSGSADVFWRNEDGTFGYVSGGHCSCYGLEGQWSPETYTADVLRGMLERSNYAFSGLRDVVKAAIGDGK